VTDFQLNKAKEIYTKSLGNAFRGQVYSDVSGEVREPIFFNISRNNRFNLKSLNLSTMYMGFEPLTALVECFSEFRYSSLPINIKLGRSRLSKFELIEFRLKQNLKLVNMQDSGALIRHRLKRDAPLFSSTKSHADSEDFAKQAVSLGYDGILFPTRQGVEKAAVIFEGAKNKLDNYEIINRSSFWEAFNNSKDLISDLNIQLIDDTLGYT